MFVGYNNMVAFIRSKYINVFPSGRRKSTLIDTGTVNNNYYIPFDPEARLNTEANNRKHSGLNGYKQSFLNDWNSDILSLVLNGYLFNIELEDIYKDKDTFAKKLAEVIGAENEIWVNIKLANIKFFSDGVNEANTEILRDQQPNAEPAASLDILITGEDSKDHNNYYFSGLSFSKQKLDTLPGAISSTGVALDNSGIKSLLLLTKDSNGKWSVCESSRLPKIDHGDTKDSVRLPGDLQIDGNLSVAGTITGDDFKFSSGDRAAYIKLVGNQLQIFNVSKS